jgi:CubicO group peptidase (beta-lactamase class C family)
VVDLWGGWADTGRRRPWTEDTLVDIFSVGKALVALVVLILVEEGRIDLGDPLSRHWPEFGAAGKEGITLRQLLSHQAGLPGVRRDLPPGALYDWGAMTSALAAEAPWWEPGSAHGYHVNTLGFLAGELVRRVTGQTFGAAFADRVARPLGVDLHFGTGPGDDDRTADFLFPPDHGIRLRPVYGNPPGISGLGTVNSRAWRAAQHPSTNGHGNARGLARVFGALATGGTLGPLRLLGADTLAGATTEVVSGPDLVLGRPSRFGIGFQLSQPERPLGPNPGAFGHFGAGGSLGFADPEAGIGFGYTMNRYGHLWQDPRNRALIDALYASL